MVVGNRSAISCITSVIHEKKFLTKIMAIDKTEKEGMQNKPTVIDLFAGCGGLSLGLHLAGWQGLFAVEKSKDAFQTLEHNLIKKEKHFDWPSWLNVGPHEIDELLEKHAEDLQALRGKVDLVAGGPPCQGFSMAGKRIEHDSRNQLVFSYIKFIDIVRPKVLLFENVKGFTCSFSKEKGVKPYSSAVRNELEKLGYNVKAEIIDFSEYGIPQKRKRFIMVGVYERENDFFNRLSSDKQKFLKDYGVTKCISVKDAISDLSSKNPRKATPGRKGFESGMYSPPSSAYQRKMRKNLPSGRIPDSHSFANHGQGTVDLFSRLIRRAKHGTRMTTEERKKWGIGRRSVFILDENAPAPTLTSNPDDIIHYSEPRILTAREYARIQTFPDWYEFKSKYTTGGKERRKEVPRYTQIANAVPPLFAELIGKTLKEICNYGSKEI